MVKSTVSDSARHEYAFLLANGYLGAYTGHYFAHLSQPVGVWNYGRIADAIAGYLPRGHMLDWGCGYGQMTYLLKRRGLEVTSYDLGTPETIMPDVPLCRQIQVIRSTHPTELPFPDRAFDAVLSSGVLEHVDEHSQPGNEWRSLREIARVVRPGGFFFIFQLPQRYAWQEALLRQLGRGYTHPRRYTASEITAMLHATGFRVASIGRANMLPKNLTGVPPWVRGLYNLAGRKLLTADAVLSGLPLLNQLAGVLEVVAVRQE
ncbi:MAG TPA: class I SAM-dependent methyltransferase [Roseiflexaceae bacterium]|jgi:SAM-dependent methyltransferase|nr:class I SAM-dependent methyltransferase [Roseiflexaceae bacterium]